MFDGGESMPLAGEEKTTLSEAPEPPPFEAPGKVTQYSTIFNNKTHLYCRRKYCHKNSRGTFWMFKLTSMFNEKHTPRADMVLVILLLHLSSPIRQCLQYVMSLGSNSQTLETVSHSKFLLRKIHSKPIPHKS